MVLSWLVAVLVVGVVLALLVVLGLLVFQERLVYVPDIGEPPLVPEQLGFVAGESYEDAVVPTPDGERLHGVLFRARAVVAGLRAGEPLRTEAVRRTPTLLWLHANAGSLASRLPAVRAVVAQVRCNVFIVDYRGYGASTGTPSEAGLQTDGAAALRWLRARRDIDAAKIVVFGRSIGGAVALHLATDPATATAFGALLLENTFTTLPDLARALLPRPLRPLARHARSQWRSIDRVRAHGVRVPTMFFAAVHDEMVPHAHMRALYDAARAHSAPALRPHIAMRTFLRGGHMTLPDANLMYHSWLHDWLADVFPDTLAPLSPDAQAQLTLFSRRRCPCSPRPLAHGDSSVEASATDASPESSLRARGPPTDPEQQQQQQQHSDDEEESEEDKDKDE